MKEDFVKIPLDEETYTILEREAKKQGLTVDELAVNLIQDLYDSLKKKEG